MTERPNDTRIHDWLDETVGPTQDPVESTRQVMSQVEETRQVGRWLPFPLSRRKARASTSTPSPTDTAGYQPSPIPASNGHTPTAIGRTTSMLSPVKAITAGALVFAIGGAFLIAQPFGQQEAIVPAAEVGDGTATWVTGDVRFANCSGPDRVMDGDVRRDRNYACAPQTWTASDPRLTGEVSRRWNEDLYLMEDASFVSVNMGGAYLQNDDGGWACTSTNLFKGGGLFPEELTGETFTCTGQGGYEGLSAVLINGESEDRSEEFVGLIFSGDFPPTPEPPAAE